MAERLQYACGWIELGADGKIADFEFRFTITGKPVVLKNSKVAVPMWGDRCSHGRSKLWKIKSSKQVERWMPGAVADLERQWPFMDRKTGENRPLPVEIEINAAIVTYTQTKARADASNLYQAPEDAMQKARILTDDYQIRTHDGCDRRLDRENPRVEICLTPARKN